MHLQPFKGSELKIARARTHLDELKSKLALFGEGLEVQIVRIGETEHHDHYTMAFNKSPPDDIPIIIGDAVHNLRAALDLMMGDVARVLNVSRKEVKFPFAESREAFENLIRKQPYSRLGSEIVETLVAMGPFRDGNGALRGLHDLDITDKHKAVLPTYVAAWGRIVIPEAFNNMIAQAFGFEFNQSRTPYCEGAKIVVAKGINPLSMLDEVEGAPEPIFRPGSPFAMDPVIHTLENLTNMVAAIVVIFEGKVKGADPKEVVGDTKD